MGCDILVDGYNVIKNNPMFQVLEVKNLAFARETLIRQLKNRYRQTTHRVIVIFDGNDVREQTQHDEHIRIIFSRSGETADVVIARLAREARLEGREVVLFSDDGEVKQNVAEQGGRSQTTHQLTSHLTAAPRDVALRAQHRLLMRRIYGIDPRYKDDDDQDNAPASSGKSRRRKKKKSRYR